MSNTKTLLAALAATTFLTAGIALAADQAMQTGQATQAQTALAKDAGKLSKDGARAYNDLALARLAIFDGRVKEAKTFADEADATFQKAKTDDSVFMKAESDMKTPDGAPGATADKSAPADKSATADSPAPNANAAKQEKSAKVYASTTPKQWLPVDAEMSVDEDYTANPTKAAAVADANKRLAKGDKQGAMEKLKLADVNIVYVMAVVPLDQTLADVHQAAQLIDGGKYYEASQTLRQVQDSTHYDMLDMSGMPTKTGAKDAPAPATH